MGKVWTYCAGVFSPIRVSSYLKFAHRLLNEPSSQVFGRRFDFLLFGCLYIGLVSHPLCFGGLFLAAVLNALWHTYHVMMHVIHVVRVFLTLRLSGAWKKQKTASRHNWQLIRHVIYLWAAIEFSVSHDVHSFHRFTPNETNLLSTTDQTNIGLVFRHFSQLRHVLKHASTGHGQAHAVMERSSQICWWAIESVVD